jgi:hypothetical protein
LGISNFGISKTFAAGAGAAFGFDLVVGVEFSTADMIASLPFNHEGLLAAKTSGSPRKASSCLNFQTRP